MTEETLYIIGLVLAVLYLTMGFDDLIWNIFSFTKREQYKKALNGKPTNIHISEYMLKKQLITEKQYLEVLAHIKGVQFVNMGDYSTYDLSSFFYKFEKNLLEEFMVLPIVFSENSFVIAYCEKSPDNAQSILRNKLGIKISSVFITGDMIEEGLGIMFGKEN